MREAARALGRPLIHPRLAVAFGQPGQPPRPGVPLIDRPGHNMFGVPRVSCRLCGECNIGCNYGSKHTMDLTVLSRAVLAGAELRPQCEVREFRPLAAGRGYRVTYVEHRPELEGTPYSRHDLPDRMLTARYLILCAGTFGSTFLLLRMRKQYGEYFAGLSPTLGTRFSGNGDLLTVVARTRRRGADGTLQPRTISGSFGPVITSAMRTDDALDLAAVAGPLDLPGGEDAVGDRGFYTEDAGYPPLLAWLAETAPTASRWGRLFRLGWRYLLRRFGLDTGARLGAALAEFIGSADFSDTSLPLLHMGRDVSDGVMSLEGQSHLEVSYDPDTSRAYIERVRATSQRMAEVLGGTHLDNPLWLLRRLITVHPIGGVPMGRTPAEGAVDPYGRVFGCPDLYVIDGAILPGPVGPNPALTIAAIADRCALQLLDDHRRQR
ncbi:MAG: GMC oxidoreductase [Myxococcota bacterium]